MKRFWLSIAMCFVCINSMAAVLYAGAPGLDSGGGFISFSPLIDCVLWGILLLLFGISAFVYRKRRKTGQLGIPAGLQFPTAYFGLLGFLSVLVLLLGATRLIGGYEYIIRSPVTIPVWAYIGLLVLLYLGGGFLVGRRSQCSLRTSLLWGTGLTLIIGGIGFLALNARWMRLARSYLEMQRQWNDSGFNGCGFLESVVDTVPGGVMARLNLPACVVMGSYSMYFYDTYQLISISPSTSIFLERVITMIICLCPPVLFAIGWVCGYYARPRCQCDDI